MTQETNPISLRLAELTKARRAAKREEELSAERRKAIDLELAKLLPKPAGGKTASFKFVDGDLSIKVSVEHGTTVKVDTEAFQRDYASLPAEVQESFRWKAELVSAKFNALDATAARKAAKYVTETPAFPSVKIEVK